MYVNRANSIDNKLKWIVAIYFALKPLYLWDSGTLQISDFYLVAMIGYFVFRTKGKITMANDALILIRNFAFLVYYQVLVNIIWSIALNDTVLNRFSLYYIFNLISFSFVIYIGCLVGAKELKKGLAIGCVLSLTITLIGVLAYSGSSSRNLGFFNNPNQLGYHGLILTTVCLYCKDEFPNWAKLYLIIGSGWAIIASLSKAAVIGYFIVLIVYILFFQQELSTKAKIYRLIAVALIVWLVYFILFSDSYYIESNDTLYHLRVRILTMTNEKDTNLDSGRGYGRIFEMGVHFLWGMGEGGFYRFESRTGAELHSTFVSLFVSYGLIGLGSYLLLMKRCLGRKKEFTNNIIVLFGLLLYSISHNGVRNTLVWILLASMFVNNTMVDKEKNYKRHLEN